MTTAHCEMCHTLREQLAAARAELDDMRQAWAILREPDDLRHAYTATEAAQQIATRHAAAIARAERAEAERDANTARVVDALNGDFSRIEPDLGAIIRSHVARDERDALRHENEALRSTVEVLTACVEEVSADRDGARVERDALRGDVERLGAEAGRLREALEAYDAYRDACGAGSGDEIDETRVRADERAKVVHPRWQRDHDASVRAAALAEFQTWLRHRQFTELAEHVAIDFAEYARWAKLAAQPKSTLAECVGCDEPTCAQCVRAKALAAQPNGGGKL